MLTGSQKASLGIITDNDAAAFFSKEQPIPPVFPAYNFSFSKSLRERSPLLKGPTPHLIGLEHAKSCQRNAERKCSRNCQFSQIQCNQPHTENTTFKL